MGPRRERGCKKQKQGERPPPYPTSSFHGVTWSPRANGQGLWRAGIQYRNRDMPCGHFEDELSAAQAHDLNASYWLGEDAVLNFTSLPTLKGTRRTQFTVAPTPAIPDIIKQESREESSAPTSTPPPAPSADTDARAPSGVDGPIFIMPQGPSTALPPRLTPQTPPSALSPPLVVQGVPSALPLRPRPSALPPALLATRMLAITTTTTTTTTMRVGEGQRGWALAMSRHMHEHTAAATRSPSVRPSLHSWLGGDTRIAPGWAGSDVILAGREGRPQALSQIWPQGAMSYTALPRGVPLDSIEASVSQSRKRPPPY